MKLIKTLLVTFFPWLIYSILVDRLKTDVGTACVISIIVLVVTGYNYLKKFFVINWVIFGVFLATLIAHQFSYAKYVQNDPWIASCLILVIISCVSLWIKKPIMQQYAKEEVSPDKWNHPLFKKINTELTQMWCVIFSINFTVHLYMIFDEKNWKILVLLAYLFSFSGILFSMFYPNYQRKISKLSGGYQLCTQKCS